LQTELLFLYPLGTTHIYGDDPVLYRLLPWMPKRRKRRTTKQKKEEHVSEIKLSTFTDLIANYTTKGSILYQGVPMSCMSPQQRGIVIEQIARAVETVTTANPEKTSRSRTKYDWLRIGTGTERTRVECKSAQLTWNRGWLVHFKNIKEHNYDVLILCLFLPHGIIIFECCDSPPLYGQGYVQNRKGKCLLLRAGKVDSGDAITSITNKLLKFSRQTLTVVF